MGVVALAVWAASMGVGLARADEKPAVALPPGALAPHFLYQADKGFIDDPLGLDADAGLAAILRTDSASFARIEILDLQAGKGIASFPVGSPEQIFERLLFTSGGKSVVVITRDPATGDRTAQRYGEKGEARGLIGPVTDFALTLRGGKKLLVGWTRGGATSNANAKGRSLFTVAAYDLATLERVGKTVAVSVEDGMIKKQDLRVGQGGWIDGYTQIIGQRVGQYDKQKDVRLPDRAAAYDLLSGKIAWEADIGDVYAWAAVNNLRRDGANRTAFLSINSDTNTIELVDSPGGRSQVKLALPFEMYDSRSLVEAESTVEGLLYFGLALDPLNPQALARRKADRAFLDLYSLPLPAVGPGPSASAGHPVEPRKLARIPLGDRPVAWSAAGHWALVLAKHKHFNRGGSELAVYQIP